MQNSKQSRYDKKLDLIVLLDQVRYMATRARENELRAFGLTLIQAAVLRLLRDTPEGATLQEISGVVTRETNSVSSLISRMQDKGLVKKQRTRQGNGIRVLITEKGKNIYNESVDRTLLTMLLSVLSGEEQRDLHILLSKLKVKASELLEAQYRPPFLSI
jgi:DNA-binding MarR family transcriptional regulator